MHFWLDDPEDDIVSVGSSWPEEGAAVLQPEESSGLVAGRLDDRSISNDRIPPSIEELENSLDAAYLGLPVAWPPGYNRLVAERELEARRQGAAVQGVQAVAGAFAAC